ncbi:hypothetical protein SAZ11_19655 [Streptomyces sp. FXJ1.4098]|nr:hypothetical protein [Streptomyces sp. FXJ1.4098]
MHIQRPGPHAQPIAALVPHDVHPDPGQHLPQPGHIPIQRSPAPAWRILTPHPIHQDIRRHHTVNEQRRQHPLLPRVPHIHQHPIVPPYRNDTQDAEPHRHTHAPVMVRSFWSTRP